jgi:Protein phosphatase 2C
MDSAGERGGRGDVLIFGAAVIGPSHVQMGLPCQDACAFRQLPDQCGVVAVADGLGSAAKSDIGARVAVEAALQAASQGFIAREGSLVDLQAIAEGAIQAARTTLEERAAIEECSLHDVACTLIVAVIRGDEVSVAHIGDGAVVGETRDGLRLISAPGESEYANEVVPITSSDWKRSLRVASTVGGVSCLAVFTDGCQRAGLRKISDGFEPFGGFFAPIFSYARELSSPQEGDDELRALLSSNKICDNSEDDKTLVIAVLRNE